MFFIDRLLPDRQQGTGWPFRWVYGRFRTWVDTHPMHALMLIMLLTLVLGVAKLWLDPPSFEFNWENRWWQIALNVARGDGYVACKTNYFPFCGPTNQVTAMREPLPVLLFALIALLTNESLLAAAATGVLVNLAIVVAVFYLARELADTRTGLLAALLWAFYLAPIRLFYSQVSGDLLATLGLTCGLVYFLRARRTERWWDWLAAGVCIGLAILSRSAVLIVALALTAGLILWPYSHRVMPRHSRDRNLRPLILFTIAWALIISPWLIRNTVAFDRPVIGSTLSGYYLYRQSYMLPTDNYLRFVSGGEFEPVLQEMVTQRSDLQGTENEAQMDQIYREEALRIIGVEPLRYTALSAYRFLMLWFNWKVNAVYGKHNAVGDYVIMIQHALLLGAGIIGLRGRWRQAWPLAVSVVAFSLLYMAVMAHLPYIVPVVPLLVAFSAITCVQVGQYLCTNGWEAVEEDVSDSSVASIRRHSS